MSTPLTDRDLLAELRKRGVAVRIAHDELTNARLMVADLLVEGLAAGLKLAPMARAAGISRQTAYNLIRRQERHAAEYEEVFGKTAETL